MNTSDQWLEELLAEPPVLRDNGFSDAAWQRIVVSQKHRRLIFVGVWLLAIFLCLSLSPWASLSDWIVIITQSETSLIDTISQLFQYHCQDLLVQLQQRWILVVGILLMAMVFIKNLFIADY